MRDPLRNKVNQNLSEVYRDNIGLRKRKRKSSIQHLYFYAWKDSSTVLSTSWDEDHCESVALTTKSNTTLPLAVATARLWVPVLAYGVSSVYT